LKGEEVVDSKSISFLTSYLELQNLLSDYQRLTKESNQQEGTRKLNDKEYVTINFNENFIKSKEKAEIN